MDTAQSIDSESPEVIREQIEETRASLGQKLEHLESEVRNTVQGASETVKETVDNVKKVFDVRYHVSTRPWTSVGLAVATGLALGVASRHAGMPQSFRGRRIRANGSSPITWARSKFQPELESAKAMAIGAGVSFLGDLLSEALPANFRPRVGTLVSSVSRKLGGDVPGEPRRFRM